MAKKTNLSLGTTTSGAFANHTGNRLESFVANALIENGYQEFDNHKRQVFFNRDTLGGKQFATQVYTGDTIYKTDRFIDILVVNKALFPDGLVIECKWQQSGGSVDEKYPYLVWNIIKLGVPTIVLLDGDGYKPAAMKWLKDQVNVGSALIAVHTMSEFQKAVNNGLLSKPTLISLG